MDPKLLKCIEDVDYTETTTVQWQEWAVEDCEEYTWV